MRIPPNFVLISVLLMQLIGVNSLNLFVEHVFLLEKFTNCEGKDNLAISIVNSTTTQIGEGKTAIKAILKVTKDIALDNVVTTFHRCTDRSYSSCEQILRYSTTEVCKMLNQNSEMWSSMVNNIEPTFHCPVKKGTYKVVNGTLDFNKSRNVIFTTNYWKFVINGFDKSENVFCALIEFHAAPYRKKSVKSALNF